MNSFQSLPVSCVTLPIELVETILSYIEDYSSLHKEESSEWKRKRIDYMLIELIKHGNISIIQLIHNIRPLSSILLDGGMACASEGGHKDLVILFKEWGATNF